MKTSLSLRCGILAALLLFAVASPAAPIPLGGSLSVDTNSVVTRTNKVTFAAGLASSNAPTSDIDVVRYLDLRDSTNMSSAIVANINATSTNRFALGVLPIGTVTNAGAGLLWSGNTLSVDWATALLTNDARYVSLAAFGLTNAAVAARTAAIEGNTQAWNAASISLTNATASSGITVSITDRVLALALSWPAINSTNDARYVSLGAFAATNTGYAAVLGSAITNLVNTVPFLTRATTGTTSYLSQNLSDTLLLTTNSGTQTIQGDKAWNGAQTFNGALTAPSATSVAPSAIANVGTLDGRYGEFVVPLVGPGNATVVTSWLVSSNDTSCFDVKPFNVAFSAQSHGILIPAKYRYIRAFTFAIAVNNSNLGTTNFGGPWLRFLKASDTAESQHSASGGTQYPNLAWTNLPGGFSMKVLPGAGSGRVVVFTLTNSVALPQGWYDNATNGCGFYLNRVFSQNMTANTLTNYYYGSGGAITFSTSP